MRKIIINEKTKFKLEKAEPGKEPSGLIEARLTTWGPREGVDGRKFNYQPEGFADFVKDFKENDRPLPMFFNHEDMDMPVGEWTDLEMDDDGMVGKGRIFTETTRGSDLYNIMKESPRMLDGVSVGAYAEDGHMVDEEGEETDDIENGFFQIKKGGLREVSVVMHANNPEARISRMEFTRSDGELNVRNIEKALREAGLSRADATAATRVLKEVISQREADDEDKEEEADDEEDKPTESDDDMDKPVEADDADMDKPTESDDEEDKPEESDADKLDTEMDDENEPEALGEPDAAVKDDEESAKLLAALELRELAKMLDAKLNKEQS